MKYQVCREILTNNADFCKKNVVIHKQIRGIAMGEFKQVFTDFSGFCGRKVKIIQDFSNNIDPRVVMEGRVLGISVHEYKNDKKDGVQRVTIIFLFGEIPSADVLHYNSHQAIYRNNKNTVIPFKISYENGEIEKLFEKITIVLVDEGE